jgi:predicted negative regulator of RcsB-dependent stress response
MATTSRPTSSLDSESIGDWLRTNARAVAIGVGVIAAVAIGVVAVKGSSTGRNARADQAYLQAAAPLANGDAATAERELRKVIASYGKASGGVQARMTLAQLLYDKGQYKEGLALLQGAGNPPEAFRNGVRALTAAGHEGAGQPAEAARIYEELAKATTSEGRKGQLMANAGRAYQAANDRASAQRIWTELVSLDVVGLSDEARVRLGELTASTR